MYKLLVFLCFWGFYGSFCFIFKTLFCLVVDLGKRKSFVYGLVFFVFFCIRCGSFYGYLFFNCVLLKKN